MEVKLAEALLRRKELQGKVDVLKQIKDKDLFEVRGKRQKISDDLARDVQAEAILLADGWTWDKNRSGWVRPNAELTGAAR